MGRGVVCYVRARQGRGYRFGPIFNEVELDVAKN